MTADTVRKLLARACKEAGGQRAWANEHSLSSGRVSEVLSGKREPPDAICDALGIKRFVAYKRVRAASIQIEGE